MTGRLAPRNRRIAVVGLTAIATLLPLAWVIAAGHPQPSQTLALSSGSAWLASPGRGYVSLIDGSSEQVVATFVGLGGPDLEVVADGESALVADGTGGTVSRIDTAIMKLTATRTFGEPGEHLQVLVGDTASYVINTSGRTAARLDLEQLTAQAPINISAQPAAQQTLLADDGRLWTVDSTGDGMSWIDPDGTTGRADSRPDTRLLEVSGRAVWVGGDSRLEIGWLADDGSHVDWPCSLGSRAGDSVQLLGSSRSDQVFAAVSESGALLVADAGGRCDAAVRLSRGGADFGALAQTDRYLFVPDRSAGSAVVVDLDTSAVVATLPLTEPGHDLELIARDGIVFYNDRDSEKAGVLKQGADGSWVAGTPLQKFDPQTGAPVNPPSDLPPSQPAEGPIESSPADDPATAQPSVETTAPNQQAAGSTPSTTSAVAGTPSLTTPSLTTPSQTAPRRTTPTQSTPSQTTPTQSTPSQSSPSPPEVGEITVAGSLVAGQQVTFRATVTGRFTNRSWSAAIGGVPLPSSSDEAFAVTLPADSGGKQITVELAVDALTPKTASFDISAPVPVIQMITPDSTNFGIGRHISFLAQVDNAAGNSYEWSAVADGTNPLGSESLDSTTPFEIDVPYASKVVVTLTVGDSTPTTYEFVPTANVTVLTVEAASPGYFLDAGRTYGCSGDCMVMSASVADGDGNQLDSGPVQFSYTDKNGVERSVTVDIDAGSGLARTSDAKDFGNQAATGQVEFSAKYLGQPGFGSSDAVHVTAQVDNPPYTVSGSETCSKSGGFITFGIDIGGLFPGMTPEAGMRDQIPTGTDSPAGFYLLTQSGNHWTYTFTTAAPDFNVGSVNFYADSLGRSAFSDDIVVTVAGNACA